MQAGKTGRGPESLQPGPRAGTGTHEGSHWGPWKLFLKNIPESKLRRMLPVLFLERRSQVPAAPNPWAFPAMVPGLRLHEPLDPTKGHPHHPCLQFCCSWETWTPCWESGDLGLPACWSNCKAMWLGKCVDEIQCWVAGSSPAQCKWEGRTGWYKLPLSRDAKDRWDLRGCLCPPSASCQKFSKDTRQRTWIYKFARASHLETRSWFYCWSVKKKKKIWEETEITAILRVTHYKQLIRTLLKMSSYMFTLNKERGNHSQFNLYFPYSPTEAIFLRNNLRYLFYKIIKTKRRRLAVKLWELCVRCKTQPREKMFSTSRWVMVLNIIHKKIEDAVVCTPKTKCFLHTEVRGGGHGGLQTDFNTAFRGTSNEVMHHPQRGDKTLVRDMLESEEFEFRPQLSSN